jgi:hypothetical protein
MNSITFDMDATKLLAAFDFVTEAIRLPTLEACHVTADNIATEARARVARRGPNPTQAQLARPPIEDLIFVQPMRNGTGYVVIVQVPGEDPYLPWQLEFGTQDMAQRPFFFAPAVLEQAAHLRRLQDAQQAGIDAVGLGA